MRGPQGFLGFEPPVSQGNLHAARWRPRFLALGVGRPGEWAKFGPYKNRRSALRGRENALERWKVDMRDCPGWKLDTLVEGGHINEPDETAFLYVRVLVYDQDDQDPEEQP